MRTMKTLAAVSIRQYEQAVESLTEYDRTIELGLHMILWHVPNTLGSPQQHKTGPSGAIVLGSDQGMCGQFNEQITSYALATVRGDRAGEDRWRFLAIGARASSRLLDAGCKIDHELPLPSSASGISDLVTDLLATIDRWRSEQRLHRILVIYNRRLSAASYQPHHLQLLPIDPSYLLRHRGRTWKSRSLPTFTMDRGALLSRFIRQHLFVSLFRACAESLAGENASRIASMQAAERNIQERLSDLRSQYHQQRQTSITEELLDVVTGYEALARGDH